MRILLAMLMVCLGVIAFAGCDGEGLPSVPVLTSPTYTVKVLDEKGAATSDPLVLSGPGVKVRQPYVLITAESKDGALPIVVKKLDNEGTLVKPDAQGRYALLPGKNDFNVFVGDHARPGQILGNQRVLLFYVGPVTVTLDPSSLDGVTGRGYTFKAVMDNPPDIGSYDWSIDGVKLGTGGGATLTHIFSQPGEFKISVKVRDTFFKEDLGIGTATARIKAT
jgi:hypothetical protein